PPPPNPPFPPRFPPPPGKPPASVEPLFSFLKRVIVFERLKLVSNNPGPVAEFLAKPRGRSLMTVSWLSSKPVEIAYGRPVFHRRVVLRTRFPGSRPLIPPWK